MTVARTLLGLALLGLTACSSPHLPVTGIAKATRHVFPWATPPLQEPEVIWIMLPTGPRGITSWFAEVRPDASGGIVTFGERASPDALLVLGEGRLTQDVYRDLWQAVEQAHVWSLPGHPPGAVSYTDPYALGVRCLVQRDGQVFHHAPPAGCRVQPSPLVPNPDERLRFATLVDTVRSVAKRAAVAKPR